MTLFANELLVIKLAIQAIVIMIMLTPSLERICNLTRYTGFICICKTFNVYTYFDIYFKDFNLNLIYILMGILK